MYQHFAAVVLSNVAKVMRRRVGTFARSPVWNVLALEWETVTYSDDLCSVLPIWQVSIFSDFILIYSERPSLVLHYLFLSSVANPRTLFLVNHKPSSLVFILLTLFSVTSHVIILSQIASSFGHAHLDGGDERKVCYLPYSVA